MAEVALILGVLLVLGVLGLIALAVWVAVAMVRLVVGGVVGLIRGTVGLLFRPVLGSGRRVVAERCCPRPSCQQGNPMEARFCRRCGRALSAASPSGVAWGAELPAGAPVTARTPSGGYVR